MSHNPDLNQISLKKTMIEEPPLQIVGVIHALAALLAKQAGFKAIYLSGAGIANCLGYPDLGMTTFTEVAEEIRKIIAMVSTPLLVDGDTGFGSTLTTQRMVKEFERAGANAVHLEDQSFPKRCGHRPQKKIDSKEIMLDRLKSALDARNSKNFNIVARTDAFAEEGLEKTLDRVLAYEAIGADVIFLEAISTLKDYAYFSDKLKIPVMANMTEFGKTPLFSLQEFASIGVKAVLYPLSAFRAMNKAALEVYQTIRQEGSQKKMITKMQTREELYQLLNYYEYEEKLK